MNKEQALQRLSAIEKESAELRKIIESTEKSKEERFLELIQGVEISRPIVDFEQYPNSIFWFDKDGNYIAEYDFKNSRFWLSYSRIWSVFESEFGLDYNKIQDFTKTMVEKHFKIKGVTTQTLVRTIEGTVEKHFKIKGVTTGSRLCDVATTNEKLT